MTLEIEDEVDEVRVAQAYEAIQSALASGGFTTSEGLGGLVHAIASQTAMVSANGLEAALLIQAFANDVLDRVPQYRTVSLEDAEPVGTA